MEFDFYDTFRYYQSRLLYSLCSTLNQRRLLVLYVVQKFAVCHWQTQWHTLS